MKRAQSTVEYVAILLLILGLFTLFLTRVKGSLQNYHQAMANRIATQ